MLTKTAVLVQRKALAGQPSSRSGQTRRAMTGQGLVAPVSTRSGVTVFSGSPSGQLVSNMCASCPKVPQCLPR